MLSVCIPFTDLHYEQYNWDYLLSNFKPDQIFVYGDKNVDLGESNVFGKAILISEIGDLPNDLVKVLLAPVSGKYIKGEKSLVDFIHPGNAVYIVGPNHTYISEDYIEESTLDIKVYIPNDSKFDMNNWVALACTLYDRKAKNG